MVESYRDLAAWQKAMDLAVDCYNVTKTFPQEELFGLTSQIRLSSSSLAANIAEGNGRKTPGACIQILRFALGSFKELQTHLNLVRRVRYPDESGEQGLLERCDELGKIIRGLTRSLQKRAKADA